MSFQYIVISQGLQHEYLLKLNMYSALLWLKKKCVFACYCVLGFAAA